MHSSRVAKMIRVESGEWNRPHIVKRPGVCGGNACINGTRLTVWGLEAYRRIGLTDQEILYAYPQLTKEDLAAAWEYVAANKDEIDTAMQANR